MHDDPKSDNLGHARYPDTGVVWEMRLSDASLSVDFFLADMDGDHRADRKLFF